jgi:hypothetical protein
VNNKMLFGGALVAGGVAAAYLAPTLPKHRDLAVGGGIAAAGLGAILLLQGWKESGGLLGIGGDLIGGGETEDLEGETTTIDVTPRQGAPIAAVGASALEARVISPAPGGTVRRGLFSGDYTIELELTNRGSRAWSGLVQFDISEDYWLDDEEHTVTRQADVLAGRTRVFRFLIPLGSFTQLSSPDVSTVISADGVELARTEYTINT